MADASDVEQALVQAAAAALYPQGTQSAVSVTGAVVRVYRGWPTNAALESDLAAGICHVSVTGVAGAQPEVEQFPAAWEVPDPVAPALDAFATNGAVTFSGAATLGQLAGVLADDDGFAYRTRAGDTPEAVAANLAAAINTVRIATVTGASVNVPGAARLVGRVVADQVAVLLTRRQRGEFRLTCWCGDPVSRDAIAAAIDVALSQTPFIALPDSTAARLRGVRSESTDDLTTLPLYRRELVFSADYATTLVQTQPSMLIGIFSADDPVARPGCIYPDALKLFSENLAKVSLVVVRAFDVHAPGDQLEEADAIARVLGGEHADYVVRVQQPDAPAARED